MKKYLVLSLLLLLSMLSAKKTIIKMATLAPQGSDMHMRLVDMGQRWTEATNGEVVLRLYPSGVVGDERDMIRKIRIGQIHAAAITTEGLSVITPDVYGFLVPMLFQDFDDVDWVRDRISGQLNTDFEQNGFIVLNWSDVGWAYWFTKDPLIKPSDLKKMRIFTWAGDYNTTQLWNKAGYESVQLAYLDVLSGLQTGLIDALATPAIMALSNQYFGPASYMLDMKWGLVTGGTVIDKRIWETIKPEYRPKILQIAQQFGREQQAVNRTLDEQAIAMMQEYGLKVYRPTKDELQEWQELTSSFYSQIRGTLIPAEIFDRVVNLKAQKDSLLTELEQ
ncbi:MAG: TRAP transporter substrate-binding protein DctP [Candidatus Neomarinimicrobiota bacterium]